MTLHTSQAMKNQTSPRHHLNHLSRVISTMSSRLLKGFKLVVDNIMKISCLNRDKSNIYSLSSHSLSIENDLDWKYHWHLETWESVYENLLLSFIILNYHFLSYSSFLMGIFIHHSLPYATSNNNPTFFGYSIVGAYCPALSDCINTNLLMMTRPYSTCSRSCFPPCKKKSRFSLNPIIHGDSFMETHI